MNDAQGPSTMRAMQDAEGVSDLRQVNNFHAAFSQDSETAEVTLHSFGEGVDPDPEELAADGPEGAAVAADDAAPPAKIVDDAVPWALSLHLEARIANLSKSTVKVNEQLDGLDESIKRLTKRIGK
jgi:hypothetical protein